MIGKTLGNYRVIEQVGVGGMGEVYRARDTKLNREVAIKVISAAFSGDAELMARFEREARVLALLNYPGIASIYGWEVSGGSRALVMELVEGPTLAERIAQGPIPLEEVLPVAKQIAEALEYAHEKGIIHRDLKPANIKVTPEGAVKVLDFGLAKAIEESPAAADATNSTLSLGATKAGVVLGTAAYMSPEQARGRPVDRRADIWSFGCVLYEMLASTPLFGGETFSDTLGAVMMREPDWQALPANTPPSIRQLLRRCLTKDSKGRLQAIGEARIAIEETLSGVPEAGAVRPAAQGLQATDRELLPPHSVGRRAVNWAVAGVLLLLAGVAGMWLESRRATPPPRWSGDLLVGQTIAFWPRVSPDNRLVAFQALVNDLTQVALTDPGAGNWTVLTHDRSRGPVSNLSWSQDSSKIYFDRFNPQPVGIYSIPALGGEERLLLPYAASPEPLRDGSLLIVRVDPDRTNQIYHFWPENGRLQALGAWVDLNPSPAVRVFPDGKEAVFFGTIKGTGSDNSPHLYTLDVSTGRTRRLAPELSIARSSQIFPLAVTLDGQSILIDLPSGNLHSITAIPHSGRGEAQTWMTLTSAAWCLDPAPDGSLYVDQVQRPAEILKFPVSGGTPEVLASTEAYSYLGTPSSTFSAWVLSAVELSDGRLLIPALVSGRQRLLLGSPGGNFSPLLETQEETGGPVTKLANDELGLMVGSPPARALAIASAKEGRIIRRFPSTEGKEVSALAASPDGESLYYISSGTLWSIPSKGGTPRKICAGDGLAVDPNGKDLIVNLDEPEHVRLVRVPLSGGPQEEVKVGGDLPLSPFPLGPGAVNKNGKAVVGVAPRDSWFFKVAILDLTTGELNMVPINYAGDIMVTGWASDGRILVTATPMRAHIWRFSPAH